MISSAPIGFFIASALLLLITPGPAVLYIIARAVEQGRLAGLVSVLGIQSGTLVHVTAAALGLSAILVTSALAFNLVKYLGAAYLIYLGIRKLLDKETGHTKIALPKQSLGQIYRQGVIVNTLNPKTALFFFAFLPQFIDPNRGNPALQILLLGLTFIGLALLSDGSYAMLAGTFGGWLQARRGLTQASKYFSGGVYITLGLLTALSGRDH